MYAATAPPTACPSLRVKEQQYGLLNSFSYVLLEQLGRKSAATTCDRFALRNYRRRDVTIEDAEASLRRDDR